MPAPFISAPQAAPSYGQRGPVYADAFKPRYRVIGALVIAKGRDGKLAHHYRGELLDWLNDEQRAHFLRHKLVEELTESDLAKADSLPSRQSRAVAAPDVNSDVVDECIKDLARLNVPADAGSPRARTTLRDAGLHYANETVAAAVRVRKERAAAVRDSADS